MTSSSKDPPSLVPRTVFALRGATTVATNTSEAYQYAIIELLTAVQQVNHLSTDAIISVWFTVTPDLTCDNPARLARTHQPGWKEMPMLCSIEPNTPAQLDRCVRVLIQYQGNPPKQPFVYLHQAANLRDTGN